MSRAQTPSHRTSSCSSSASRCEYLSLGGCSSPPAGARPCHAAGFPGDGCTAVRSVRGALLAPPGLVPETRAKSTRRTWSTRPASRSLDNWLVSLLKTRRLVFGNLHMSAEGTGMQKGRSCTVGLADANGHPGKPDCWPKSHNAAERPIFLQTRGLHRHAAWGNLIVGLYDLRSVT